MAGTSLLCQPIAPPHPQVLELTHLPKGLCMKSQQGWPHLSAFSLDFIQSTPQNGPQSFKYGNFIPSRRKCSGKKKIHFAFQMSKDFQNYESKQIRVEDSQIIT